jgi:hypothetical protein
MKRVLSTLLIAAVAALCGCAGGSSGLARHEPMLKADALYVAKVEAIAKRRGVQVRWVNPPREIDRRVATR